MFVAQESQVIFLQLAVIVFPETRKIEVNSMPFFGTETLIEGSGILIKIARLPQQVQCNIGKGNILLQHRTVTCPLGITLTQDQRVIRKMKSIEKLVRHILKMKK